MNFDLTFQGNYDHYVRESVKLERGFCCIEDIKRQAENNSTSTVLEGLEDPVCETSGTRIEMIAHQRKCSLCCWTGVSGAELGLR